MPTSFCSIPKELSRELNSNEHVLWLGEPCQSILLFRLRDCFLIPLSIAWIGFLVMVVWRYMPWPPISRADRLIDVVLILLCAIGAYLAVGRLLLDCARRRHTWYAVTSSHVFIKQNWPVEKLLVFEPSQLTNMVLDEGFGEYGTIRFFGNKEGETELMFGEMPLSWFAPSVPPRFEQIPEVRRVYDLIRSREIELGSQGQNKSSWGQNKRL